MWEKKIFFFVYKIIRYESDKSVIQMIVFDTLFFFKFGTACGESVAIRRSDDDLDIASVCCMDRHTFCRAKPAIIACCQLFNIIIIISCWLKRKTNMQFCFFFSLFSRSFLPFYFRWSTKRLWDNETGSGLDWLTSRLANFFPSFFSQKKRNE